MNEVMGVVLLLLFLGVIMMFVYRFRDTSIKDAATKAKIKKDTNIFVFSLVGFHLILDLVLEIDRNIAFGILLSSVIPLALYFKLKRQQQELNKLKARLNQIDNNGK